CTLQRYLKFVVSQGNTHHLHSYRLSIKQGRGPWYTYHGSGDETRTRCFLISTNAGMESKPRYFAKLMHECSLINSPNIAPMNTSQQDYGDAFEILAAETQKTTYRNSTKIISGKDHNSRQVI